MGVVEFAVFFELEINFKNCYTNLWKIELKMKAPVGWLREKGRQQSEVVDIVCLGEKQGSGYRISRSTCRTSGDCFCGTEKIVMSQVNEAVIDSNSKRSITCKSAAGGRELSGVELLCLEFIPVHNRTLHIHQFTYY